MNKIFQIGLVLIILNSYQIANAVIVSELYNSEIEITAKQITDANKSNLIKIEFDKILRKITGKNISLPLENAEQYLSKYAYLDNYPSEEKLTLKLYFDKNLINKTLFDHRYVVLNENRPLTLIWVKINHTPLFEIIQKFLNIISVIGNDYGIKIVYPILDLAEVQLLNQNIEHDKLLQSIQQYSKKYDADEIIFADCQMHEQGFIMNWKSINNSWEFKDQLIDNYESNDHQNDKLEHSKLNIQANIFIENLFQHFIDLQINNTKKVTQQMILLKINNIQNLEDYVKVEKYLQELPITNSLYANKFQSEQVEIKIILTGGKTAIKKALASNDLFRYEHDNENINNNVNNNINGQLPNCPSLSYTFQYY